DTHLGLLLDGVEPAGLSVLGKGHRTESERGHEAGTEAKAHVVPDWFGAAIVARPTSSLPLDGPARHGGARLGQPRFACRSSTFGHAVTNSSISLENAERSLRRRTSSAASLLPQLVESVSAL